MLVSDTGGTTAPVWIYSASNRLGTYPSSTLSWLDAGEWLASKQKVDASSNPRLVDADGLLTAPVAEISCIFGFTVTATLSAGCYRLSSDTCNIGILEAGFAGYKVEAALNGISLGDTWLLGIGSNSIEFVISENVASNWILALTWTNPIKSVTEGIQRQLLMQSMRLDTIAQQLYKVSRKTLATGGDPTDSNVLAYTCLAAVADGESVHSSSTLSAYNCPGIVGSTFSNNDDYAGETGYATTLTVTTFDYDTGNTPTFSWESSAGTALTVSAPINVGAANRTWKLRNTARTVFRSAYTSYNYTSRNILTLNYQRRSY